MTLNYKKWSAEEDKTRGLIPDGQYAAIVDTLTLKMTKSGRIDKKGNPIEPQQMLEVDLIVIDMANRERKLKDWILLQGDMSWKMRHICIAAGLEDHYDNDTIELRMLTGKQVVIDLKSKDGQNQEGQTVKRNYVADYLKPADQTGSDFKDDEIGF